MTLQTPKLAKRRGSLATVSRIGIVFCLAMRPPRRTDVRGLVQLRRQAAIPYAALVQDSTGISTERVLAAARAVAARIFKLETDGTLTTLHSFKGSDGVRPYAALIADESGNLYGTTSDGGGSGGNYYGTVFELDPSGTLTTLHAFSPFVQGATPRGSLVRDEAGNLYGTTLSGGLAPIYGVSYGIAFKVDPSGTMTTLHTFSYLDGGVYPMGRSDPRRRGQPLRDHERLQRAREQPGRRNDLPYRRRGYPDDTAFLQPYRRPIPGCRPDSRRLGQSLRARPLRAARAMSERSSGSTVRES